MANYASIANMGDPLSNGWRLRNLTTIKLPNGQSWTVNKQAAPAFRGLFDALQEAGYDPKSSGGFNYRAIRGGSRLSQHAFGNAIDIDAANNPLGSTRTNMPANIADLAAKAGLEWGGNWKRRPDPMHFEWKGPATGVAPQAGLVASAPQAPVPSLQATTGVPEQSAPTAGVPSLAQTGAPQTPAQTPQFDDPPGGGLMDALGKLDDVSKLGGLLGAMNGPSPAPMQLTPMQAYQGPTLAQILQSYMQA